MKRMRGLGLLELLVAIVLLTLASTLVVQGIGQGLGLFARVSADQGEAYHTLMARGWVRQSIAAAVSGDGSAAVFRGTDTGLVLETYRPLLGPEGIPTRVAWDALRGDGLLYTEAEQAIGIPALPALQRIEYQAQDGEWLARWPPEDAAPSVEEDTGEESAPPALPQRVRLVFADGERLDVTLLARRDAPPGMDEIQGEDIDD